MPLSSLLQSSSLPWLALGALPTIAPDVLDLPRHRFVQVLAAGAPANARPSLAGRRSTSVPGPVLEDGLLLPSPMWWLRAVPA